MAAFLLTLKRISTKTTRLLPSRAAISRGPKNATLFAAAVAPSNVRTSAAPNIGSALYSTTLPSRSNIQNTSDRTEKSGRVYGNSFREDTHFPVIKKIKDETELQRLVHEIVHHNQDLGAEDIHFLIIPLMDQIELLMAKTNPKQGAEWNEQLLFACLSRIVSLDYPTRRANAATLPIPTAKMYINAMMAWGETKTWEGAQEATKIFELMVSEHNLEQAWVKENDPNNSYTMTSPAACNRCYKSLIRAWAVVADRPGGAEQADKYLTELEDKCGVTDILRGVPVSEATANKTLAFPDLAVYNSVMSAYSKSPAFKCPDSLERVKALAATLDRLQEISNDKSSYPFHVVTYQAILRSYSKYASIAPRPLDPKVAGEIKSLLQRIHKHERSKSGKSIFKYLSMSWARGIEIQALVKTEPLEQTIPKADAIIFDMLRRYEATASMHGEPDFYPSPESALLVAKGWAQTDFPFSNQRIGRLAKLIMNVPYERIYYLNTEMEMLVRSGWQLAPETVEGMLENALKIKSHIKFKPTGQTFAIAIKAWLRSQRDEAPHRAELLLQKMLDLYVKKGDRWYRPREKHLRSLMTAWYNRANKGRRFEGTAGTLYPAEHNEHLLLMYQDAEWFDNVQGSYALAIRTWSNQIVGEGPNEPHPLERAYRLAQQLKEKFGKLSAFPTNWVLEACCKVYTSTESRLQAYSTAVDVFNAGEKNARTFVLIVRAIKMQVGNELNDEHVKVIEELFSECCLKGMLTQDLVQEVIYVLPASSLQRLFRWSYTHASLFVQTREDFMVGSGSFSIPQECIPPALDIRNLPHEWSEHANTGRRLKAQDDD